MSRISQREARRLRKRVAELESQQEGMRRRWSQQYPGGVQIASLQISDGNPVPSIIRTARALEHAVVVIGDDGQSLRFIALPLPKDQR